MVNTSAISKRHVLILAGAIIAFTIGSGFATGQEIMQYYTSYGMAFIGTVVVFAVLFLYYNFNFAKAGAEQRFARANDIYKYYCGKKLGTVLDYYSTAFCYMSFWVMIGGAASTLQQQYALPHVVGGIVLAAITIVTVAAGLDKLVDAIGIVGPIIVVLVIIIAIVTLVGNASSMPDGLAAIASAPDGLQGATADNNIKQAAADGVVPGWLMSGFSYAGFVLLWFAAFTSALGMKNKLVELNRGIIGGTIAVCAAILLVTLAQVCTINVESLSNPGVYVWNADIPNLILAEKILPAFSAVFAIVVFAGIYTTAVPLLYNPVSRFAEEGTMRFRLLALALGIIGTVVGLFLPFRVLVNVIYVINGYVGAALLIFMVARNIRDFVRKRSGAVDDVSTGVQPEAVYAAEGQDYVGDGMSRYAEVATSASTRQIDAIARIAEAAAALLAAEGPQAVTATQVAEQAGVSTSEVVEHFAKSDELLLEAAETNATEWVELARRAADHAESLSHEEAHERIVELLVEAHLPASDWVPVNWLGQMMLVGESDTVMGVYRQYRPLINAELSRILIHARVDIEPWLVKSVVDGATIKAVSEGYMIRPTVTEQLTKLLEFNRLPVQR